MFSPNNMFLSKIKLMLKRSCLNFWSALCIFLYIFLLIFSENVSLFLREIKLILKTGRLHFWSTIVWNKISNSMYPIKHFSVIAIAIKLLLPIFSGWVGGYSGSSLYRYFFMVFSPKSMSMFLSQIKLMSKMGRFFLWSAIC